MDLLIIKLVESIRELGFPLNNFIMLIIKLVSFELTIFWDDLLSCAKEAIIIKKVIKNRVAFFSIVRNSDS